MNNDKADSRRVESGFSKANVADVLSPLWAASTVQDVLGFTHGPLQRLLPHGAFACTMGEFDSGGYRPKAVLTVNFPHGVWWNTHLSSGLFFDPFMRAWLATRSTQVITSSDPGLDCRSAEALNRGGLQNAAAYGVRELAAECLSFFTFHRLAEGSRADHHVALKLVVPQLHSALAAVFHQGQGFSRSGSANAGAEKANVWRLTEREREILNWIRLGKTNAEIASILGITRGTVKNQVQTILTKLRVSNRAQAVAAAIARGFPDFL